MLNFIKNQFLRTIPVDLVTIQLILLISLYKLLLPEAGSITSKSIYRHLDSFSFSATES
jgi:hypothetical protein